MRWILVAILALVLLTGLLTLFFPPRVDPVAWQPDPNPGLTGPFAPNDRLGDVERLIEGVGVGPEDVACGPDGVRYTGFHDGRIVRFTQDGSVTELANTGGRPLGMQFDAVRCQRCRHHGVSPWISLRMNDVHFNDNLAHPFHGDLYHKPELFRQGHPGYYARGLDYAHAEVRRHYRALIAETLQRYDIDGLELDFMREPYLFSKGEEQARGEILTQWLCKIRTLVEEAAARRGHGHRRRARRGAGRAARPGAAPGQRGGDPAADRRPAHPLDLRGGARRRAGAGYHFPGLSRRRRAPDQLA